MISVSLCMIVKNEEDVLERCRGCSTTGRISGRCRRERRRAPWDRGPTDQGRDSDGPEGAGPVRLGGGQRPV